MRNQKKNKQSQLIRSSLLVIALIFFLDCKKKYLNEDIDECDPVSNLYESGDHYIKRDLITEDGVIDYQKLLESYKQKNSRCYPIK